jgi:insulysin
MRDVKPELFAAHVLGHEGKGSLLATLKQEKLAEGISAGSLLLGDRNMEFILDISLTDNGVKNVDKVIMHVFETIARLKERGIPQYIYDELHATTTLDYQYMQKSDPFSEIMQHAEALRRESLSTYPQKTYTISHFDQEATNEIISLLTPTNGVYVLLAPQKLTGIAFDKREEWMNVQYSVKPIPMTILQSFEKAQPNPKIDLPEPNLYVPDQLASSSTEQPPAVEKEQNSALPIPTLLIDNNMGKVYFAKDDRYLIPKSFWTFELKTPLITAASPLSFVLGDLYEKQMMEALKDISYPASQAGLTFTIERTDEGISLSVEGYSEKAALLFHDILKEMKSFKPSEKLFKMFKEILDRQYQNTALEKPLAQATEYLKDKLYKAFVTDREKALAIKNVTYSQYEEFCSHLFKKYYVQGLLYGNEEADAAGRISDKIFSELKGKPFPKEEQAVDEVITLPEDKGPFYFEFKGKTPSNVAILAIETVPYTYRDRASQLILMQAMNQPFNASLRTKQQTGYIVTSRAEELELHLFNTFAVQSSTHNGRDLIARFELFIEDFMQELKEVNVPRQRFENIRNALVKTFEQPPTNLIDMGKMLNRLAFGYDGDFLWRQKLIDNFKALSYDEFIDYAVKAMGKQNKRRLAILLKGPLSQNETLDYFKISNASQLIKLSTFQPGKHINDEIVNR